MMAMGARRGRSLGMVSVRETLKRLFETAKAKGETGIRYSVFGIRC